MAVLSYLPAWIDFLHGHDTWSHLSWNLGFSSVLQEGIPYPRWLPDVNQGEGGPLFFYYGPLFSYAVALVTPAVGVVTGMKIAAFLFWWGSAAVVFVCARPRMGNAAATGAALTYLLLPYHLYDLYERGALAELTQFVWLPLIFCGALRVQERKRWSDLAIIAIVVAASILSHAVTACIFLYLIGVYCLWLFRKDRGAALRIAAAVGLGLMLASVYLLPAIAYRPYINPSFLQDHWNYRNNLLFSEPANAATAATQTWTLRQVILLALLLGSLALFRNKVAPANTINRGEQGAWLAVGSLAIFMTVPLSQPLWELPGLRYVMFPMRWLVLGSLAASFLVGLALAGWRKPGWARILVISAIGLNFLLAGGIWGRRMAEALQHTHPWQQDASLIAAARFRSEITAPPAWVPSFEQRLLHPEQFTSGDLALILPPAAGRIKVTEWQPYARSLRVETESPATVELRTFYFPAWKCHSAGRDTPLQPSARGRIMVAVAPGASVLTCRFTRMPLEVLGGYLSMVGLVFLLLTVAWHLYGARPGRLPEGPAA